MAERVARERKAENGKRRAENGKRRAESGERSFDVAVVAGGVGTKKIPCRSARDFTIKMMSKKLCMCGY